MARFKFGKCVLTKNKHVALTVGASGNLRERIPGDQNNKKKELLKGDKHFHFVFYEKCVSVQTHY